VQDDFLQIHRQGLAPMPRGIAPRCGYTPKAPTERNTFLHGLQGLCSVIG